MTECVTLQVFQADLNSPPQILHLLLDKQISLAQACLRSGISKNKEIGSTEGLVGILTKGKLDRKAYSKQCIAMALLQLESYNLYEFS